MALDQFGGIYCTGTANFIGGVENELIFKYNAWDLNTKVASVVYDSNDLGDGMTAPSLTQIVRPVWDGSRLLVFDVDDAKTRLFIYDRDLTFIAKYTLDTSAEASTTVDQDSASGAKTLYVAATTGFAVGDWVIIGKGTAREEAGRVETVNAGVSLSLVENLATTHSAADADPVKERNYRVRGGKFSVPYVSKFY